MLTWQKAIFSAIIVQEERWQSWSIASDLKSDEVQASVGSNPTFSVLESTLQKSQKLQIKSQFGYITYLQINLKI